MAFNNLRFWLFIFGILFVGGIGLMLYSQFVAKQRVYNRVKQVMSTISYLSPLSNAPGNRRLKYDDKLRYIEQLLKATIFGYTRETASHYRLRFEQAGFSSTYAPIITVAIKLIMIVTALVMYFLAFISFKAMSELGILTQIIFLIFVAFFATRLLEYILDFIISSRYKSIQKVLPFSVDLLAICTRSSFSLDRSFEKISEEIFIYNREVSKEFMRVALELSVIPDRTQALRNLARRIDVPMVHLLVSSLIHATEQGVSLNQTLTNLSQEFSKQRLMEVEVKAARLPVLLTIPLALFCLPALMLVLLGPIAVQMMDSPFLK